MGTAVITEAAIIMGADITVDGTTEAIITAAGIRMVDTTHGEATGGMAGAGEEAGPSS